jgi:hypothetical protein
VTCARVRTGNEARLAHWAINNFGAVGTWAEVWGVRQKDNRRKDPMVKVKNNLAKLALASALIVAALVTDAQAAASAPFDPSTVEGQVAVIAGVGGVALAAALVFVVGKKAISWLRKGV